MGVDALEGCKQRMRDVMSPRHVIVRLRQFVIYYDVNNNKLSNNFAVCAFNCHAVSYYIIVTVPAHYSYLSERKYKSTKLRQNFLNKHDTL